MNFLFVRQMISLILYGLVLLWKESNAFPMEKMETNFSLPELHEFPIKVSTNQSEDALYETFNNSIVSLQSFSSTGMKKMCSFDDYNHMMKLKSTPEDIYWSRELKPCLLPLIRFDLFAFYVLYVAH